MATQAQIDALEALLASGASETEIRQGEVSQRLRIRSRADLEATIERLKAELAGNQAPSRVFVTSHSRD